MSRALIDCDVHNVVGPIETLEPYLDDHWREVIATSQFAGPTDQAHPPNLATSRREDLRRVDGAEPGRTVDALRAQLLDPLGLECAILSCDYGVESVRNPDAAAALARAVNDWQIDRWLEPEPRLRAAIVVAEPAAVAGGGGDRAARRATPQFVAVYLPVRSAIPYGNRVWWPLLEAAVEHELVVELQFGGSPGLPPTAVGLADLVARGVRRHGLGVPVAADEPGRRGGVRSLSRAARVAGRVRVRLAARLHVALRQGLAGAAARDPVDAAAAVRVPARARPRGPAAGRRTARAGRAVARDRSARLRPRC